MTLARLPGAAFGVVLMIVSGVLGSGAAAMMAEYRLLELGERYVKWGDPVLGTGAEVTYSYVARPRQNQHARNCSEIVPIDKLLERSGITDEAFRREADAAFAMWEAASNITFRYVADPASADILIGAQGKPRGRAFTNVSFEEPVAGTIGKLTQSLICLNPALPWKIGFDGNVQVYDLRYTIAHEAGHAIGLNHPGPSGQVMSFEYHEQFRQLQRGDRSGAAALYGLKQAPIQEINY